MSNARTTEKILIVSPTESSLLGLKKVLRNAALLKTNQPDALTESYRKTHSIFLIDLTIDHAHQLIQSIKTNDPSKEIVVFSDQYNSDQCISACKAGATDYFCFPINPEELLSLIHNICEDLNDFRKMETSAFKAFLDGTHEKSIAAKEMYDERRLAGGLISIEEMAAIFSDSQSSDKVFDKNSRFENDFEKRLFLLKKFILEAKDSSSEILGTDIQVLFPLHERLSQPQRKKLKSEIGEELYKKYLSDRPVILIVEDEEDFRRKLHELLSRISPNIIEANSAEDAIKKISKIDRLDIKILDIGLPGKSGVELHPIIDEKFPDSQTIMLTAYDDLEYVTSSFGNLAYDYLIKPPGHDALIRKVSQAVQRQHFKQLLLSMGKNPSNDFLSEGAKMNVLGDIFRRRERHGSSLNMKDIYLLFPELGACKIPESTIIPANIIHDGISLFIDAIRIRMALKEDCMTIIKDWDNVFN